MYYLKSSNMVSVLTVIINTKAKLSIWIRNLIKLKLNN